jgi:hypothetical protein
MKRVCAKVTITLIDESGSHSVGHGSLMGSYDVVDEVDEVEIVDEAFDEDPKSTVKFAIQKLLVCSSEKAAEVADEVVEKIVSV